MEHYGSRRWKQHWDWQHVVLALAVVLVLLALWRASAPFPALLAPGPGKVPLPDNSATTSPRYITLTPPLQGGGVSLMEH